MMQGAMSLVIIISALLIVVSHSAPVENDMDNTEDLKVTFTVPSLLISTLTV